MKFYSECQKTLIVDGKLKNVPEDWDHVQVPRKNGKFCWGRMWDAGVLTARNESILYLDSDRLLPSNFLEKVLEKVDKDNFVYTSNHFMMSEESPLEICQELLKENNPFESLSDRFLGFARYEPRHGLPNHQSVKNVMSGSTAFMKKTYLRLGGVDHWYCGHGAFADTDFHMTASVGGCKFVDLGSTELHFPHEKLNDKDQKAITATELQMLSLDNFIYYCQKWRLQITLAEELAKRIGVRKPNIYVKERIKQICH